MTTAGVAAVAGQQRLDVVDEVQRARFVEVVDVYLNVAILALGFDADDRRAFADGPHEAARGDTHNVGRFNGVGGVAGEINLLGAADKQLATFVQAAQGELRREDFQLCLCDECRGQSEK